MPQLDYVIVFPQIFWLIMGFMSSYIILSHYFLPKFLRSLKARKEVIDFNSANSNQIQKDYEEKQIFLNKLLNSNLILVRDFLFKESILLVSNGSNINFNVVDTKVAVALYNFVLYCSVNTIDCVQLRPKLANLYFKEKS